MEQQEVITFQTLACNEDIQIGYSDNDIMVVDSIQKFTQVQTAHVEMNAVVICTSGKIQGQMNGSAIELCKNQVAVIPQHVIVTDVMVSPDFDLKAMFLTNRILQSFLREKMTVWNEMMYIHRLNIITLADEDLLFYTHFYDMLSLSVQKGRGNPFYTEVVQSLLRSAILGLCGAMKQILPSLQATASAPHVPPESLQGQNAIHTAPAFNGREHFTSNTHFRRFLDLLHSGSLKHRTVEAYANELCISPKYLTVVCKKSSGRTANEWIREKVLEDIRYYLKQTDLSVKQICDRLGFPNASFFGKYVKEHFGMTPMRFRSS